MTGRHRRPLTVINGCSALLLDELREDDPAREDLVAIQQAGEGAGAPIHLLISDVVMPYLGGELAERILGMRPECRVLFLSGYTDDAMIGLGVEAGDYGFLQKPFTPALLAARVRSILSEV